MSHLLSRLLLAFVLVASLPIVYIIILFCGEGLLGATVGLQVFAGAITAGVALIGWILAWRRQVRWSRKRRALTVASVAWSLIVAVLAGLFLYSLAPRGQEEAVILSTFCWVVLWLGSTALIWCETASERAERLRAAARGMVTCLNCGYNLTGLHEARCPECGSRFTIDELLAGAREHGGRELERA